MLWEAGGWEFPLKEMKVSSFSYTQIGNSMALDWGWVGSHQSHMLSTETYRRVKSEGHCEI